MRHTCRLPLTRLPQQQLRLLLLLVPLSTASVVAMADAPAASAADRGTRARMARTALQSGSQTADQTASQTAMPSRADSPIDRIALADEHAGRWDAAHRRLREGIRAARRAGDRRTQAARTAQLGSVLRRLERWDEARDAFRTALRLSSATGDRFTQAAAWFGIGEVGYYKATYYLEGDLTAPRAAVQRSLELREAIGDTAGTAESLHRLGTITERLKADDEAHAYFARGAARARAAGDPRSLANNFTHLASRHAERNELEQALAYDLEAVALAEREGGSRLGLAFYLANVGADYQSQGDLPQALIYARRALDVSESLRHRLTTSRSLSLLAELHAAQGRLDEAAVYGERALATACKAKLARTTFDAWLSLGDLDAKRGDTTSARASYAAARRLARAHRYADGVSQASARLAR